MLKNSLNDCPPPMNSCKEMVPVIAGAVAGEAVCAVAGAVAGEGVAEVVGAGAGEGVC